MLDYLLWPLCVILVKPFFVNMSKCPANLASCEIQIGLENFVSCRLFLDKNGPHLFPITKSHGVIMSLASGACKLEQNIQGNVVHMLP